MNKLDEILFKQKKGFLATIDNGRPRIRPFEIQLLLDSPFKYYLCTANSKAVYHQLQKSPFVEFSLATPSNIILRITGKIRFDDDMVIKQKIVDTNDLVRSIYRTGDNPNFELFYIEEGEALITYLDNRDSEYFTIYNK
ncbi:pyridoxamine 5'-phosphate oxidase family protein [Priestia megaterium]|uniref:pyridoxamine 5'-phosphate oxidase family protein n=1 Tax=Priestia megaterium TaxID=1404 RepID=UPI00203E4134|nr:pyridoxamine 5'-phosphate oxidase family protein [Priestia megaterium]MCM3186851.1 pyridoxamine 5'-phosphate oxidase family protein [Priestia megaterium]